MRVTWKGLKRLISNLLGDHSAIMSRNSKKIAAGVKKSIYDEAPVDTMALRDSIDVRSLGAQKYEIIEGKPYGVWVREGARPHDIYPVNAKALWWPGIEGGRSVAHVYHPGIQNPNPYVERGILNYLGGGRPEEAELLRELITFIVRGV